MKECCVSQLCYCVTSNPAMAFKGHGTVHLGSTGALFLRRSSHQKERRLLPHHLAQMAPMWKDTCLSCLGFIG